MKKAVRFGVIVTLLVALFGCASQAPIKMSVDAVSGTNTTTLRMDWAWFGGERIFLYFKQEKGENLERYLIKAECTKKTWWEIEALYFLVDGERFYFEPVSVEKHSILEQLTEVAIFESSLAFFQSLAFADDVDFQIGGLGGKTEYAFSKDDFENFQDFLNLIRSWA